MTKIIWIAVFGIAGVLARYFMGLLIPRFLAPPFPYGTFLINISGAFAIGVIYVLGTERAVLPADLRVAIMVGFLGGFTTFSSFCLEAVHLIEQAEYFYAGAYVALSNTLGLGAVFAGMALTRKLMGGTGI